MAKATSPLFLVFSDPFPDGRQAPAVVCARIQSLALLDVRAGDWRVVFDGVPDRCWTPAPAHPDGILLPGLRGSRKQARRYRRLSVETAFQGPLYSPEILATLGGYWVTLDPLPVT